MNSRRGVPHKNVILVSGLPLQVNISPQFNFFLEFKLNNSKTNHSTIFCINIIIQDPSLIGVNLYVAAMLSRMQPSFPVDVSFIPLAHPREYDNKWRKVVDKVTPSMSLSAPGVNAEPEEAPQGIVPENVSLELRECCSMTLLFQLLFLFLPLSFFGFEIRPPPPPQFSPAVP